jgi:hypothetical protein
MAARAANQVLKRHVLRRQMLNNDGALVTFKQKEIRAARNFTRGRKFMWGGVW